MSVTRELNWANALTREARGLIASAMLQSVAHRTRPVDADVWTSIESRERHRIRRATLMREETDEAIDDAPFRMHGAMDEIRAGLARDARGGGCARHRGPAACLLCARPVGTGNVALDEAIADLPDRLAPADRADEAPVIGIFSSDPMIQRIGLRELFNREARQLFIAPGAEPLTRPRFYQWQLAATDEADDRPAPALPCCAMPTGIDAQVWQALAREGLLMTRCRGWLAGYFTAINPETVAAESAHRQSASRALRLRLVGHGTTIDVDGRHPVRHFARIAAPALAEYLITSVLPTCAVRDARGPEIWIDFVACALAVPGESATSRHSYIGTFLRALHALWKGNPLMDRIRVSASTHVLMFQPGNFKKCREVVVAGLTLTPTRAQLREFGLASTVTVRWQGGAPVHLDANAPSLDARARKLLEAYAAAWVDWDRKGKRWRKNDVPSRFVLFDTLLDTAVRLEHKDDIAIIQTFIDRVSPGAFGPVEEGAPTAAGRRRRIGLFARTGPVLPRSEALPIRPTVRKVSLDHGQWRAHYVAAAAGGSVSESPPAPTARLGRAWHRSTISESPDGATPAVGGPAVAGSLEESTVSLALALQKIMTSRAYLARLTKTQQKAMRRYYMTPWRMVDEAVFRRIGLPTTAVEFVARWKGLATRSRPVRLGGEILQGLVSIGTQYDVKVARRVVELALYQGAFLALTDPDRQAFLSGDGALVYYGRGPGTVPGGADRSGPTGVDGMPTVERVGWHVHAFDNGRPVCKWLADEAAWEAAWGALGRIVAKHAADILLEIDAIRMRLVMDVVTVGSTPDVEAHFSPAGDAAIDPTGQRDRDGIRASAAVHVPFVGSDDDPDAPVHAPLCAQGHADGAAAGAGVDVAARGPAPGSAAPIWGPWRDARARQSADDDRHGCSGSPRQ